MEILNWSNVGSKRLGAVFFTRDVLDVAPELPGKFIVVMGADHNYMSYMITEVEAYRGTDDLACHASKGRTSRTEVMYRNGGCLYVFLIYGMYWMLNIVTAGSGNPQAVLIRGIEGYNGPGKLSRGIGVDRSFNGLDITSSDRLFICDFSARVDIKSSPRIGIDYAGEPWVSKPWRYFIVQSS